MPKNKPVPTTPGIARMSASSRAARQSGRSAIKDEIAVVGLELLAVLQIEDRLAAELATIARTVEEQGA